MNKIKNVDLNQRNKDNMTPLLLAVKLNRTDLIEPFL